MVSTGPAGSMKHVKKEEEEEEKKEKQLLKELQALSHALHRAQHPASSKAEATLNASEKKQAKEGGFQRPSLEVRNSSALLQESKSRSGWRWRPLRALSHLGQQAFQCLFQAHVHAITNLPASMTGLRLNVHFSQRSSHAQTLPCRVSQGSAEIDEVVSIRCTVYGWSRKASQGMKYAPKCLMLSVVAVDLNDLEVDRHQLDLTQMLPDKLSEGCGRKDVDQTTRFYLSGKANGGTLMVSFGYEILPGNKFRQGDAHDDGGGGGSVVGKSKPALNSLQNSRNLPPPTNADSLFPRVSDSPVDAKRRHSMEDLRVLERNTVSNSLQFPRRSSSFSRSGVSEGDSWGFNSKTKRIGGLHALQMGDSEIQARKIMEEDSEDNLEFEVEDHGLEISTLSANAAMILPPILENIEEEFETPKQLDVIVADKHPLPVFFPSIKVEDNEAEVVVIGEQTRKWTLNDPSSEIPSVSNTINPQKFNVHDNLHGKGIDVFQKIRGEKNMDLIDGKKAESLSVTQLKTEENVAALSLDDEEDLIEEQFLQMLEGGHQFHQHSFDDKQNSPKFSQVKRIGSEALLNGVPSLPLVPSPVSDLRPDDDQQKLSSSIAVLPGNPINMKNQDSVICGSGEDSNLLKSDQKIGSKVTAKLLEDAETEALMHEWGLDDKAFQIT